MPASFSASDLLDEHRALITLSLVSGVGPGRLRALVARFGTAARALDVPARMLARVDGIGPGLAAAIAAAEADALVDEQLRRAAACEADLLTGWSDGYPKLLNRIYDPPALLWVRGRIVPDAPCVAVVGTRRPSAYGRRTAFDLAADLARRGITVVSGLAYGIDTAAHDGALAGGGRTVAVLGSGVDRVYPSRNAGLARRIIDRGALVSEFPLGAAPDAVNFPRRNRILSGMAAGTVVVEAFDKGGALITAHLALEQNREVFAVPGDVGRATARGVNGLIRDAGAKLVTNVDDILDELFPETQREGSHSSPASSGPGLVHELPPMERRLYDALTPDPIHLDRLCLDTGLDPSVALVHLLQLEFKGLVRQLAGKQFYRPS